MICLSRWFQVCLLNVSSFRQKKCTGGTLAAALQYWSTQTWYRKPDDWVFASFKMHGMQPYWPETLLRCYVQPAASRVGIGESKSDGIPSVEPLQRF